MDRERVILIKGGNSNWYEQAIFIVKRDMPAKKIPKDFVLEAEKIISEYMAKNKISSPQQKLAQKYTSSYVTPKPKPMPVPVKKSSGRAFNFFMNLIMLIGCVFIAGLLMAHYL